MGLLKTKNIFLQKIYFFLNLIFFWKKFNFFSKTSFFFIFNLIFNFRDNYVKNQTHSQLQLRSSCGSGRFQLGCCVPASFEISCSCAPATLELRSSWLPAAFQLHVRRCVSNNSDGSVCALFLLYFPPILLAKKNDVIISKKMSAYYGGNPDFAKLSVLSRSCRRAAFSLGHIWGYLLEYGKYAKLLFQWLPSTKARRNPRRDVERLKVRFRSNPWSRAVHLKKSKEPKT